MFPRPPMPVWNRLGAGAEKGRRLYAVPAALSGEPGLVVVELAMDSGVAGRLVGMVSVGDDAVGDAGAIQLWVSAAAAVSVGVGESPACGGAPGEGERVDEPIVGVSGISGRYRSCRARSVVWLQSAWEQNRAVIDSGCLL